MRTLLVIALLAQVPAAPEAEVRRVAMEGWNAARALAPKGGAVELLGPVNVRLRELDAMPNTSVRYAEVAIRAAVSAAHEADVLESSHTGAVDREQASRSCVTSGCAGSSEASRDPAPGAR